jgi:hypothetical protein
MAQSGRAERDGECPLLGVKRTWLLHRKMSACDPKRTSKWRCSAWILRIVIQLADGPEVLVTAKKQFFQAI